MKIEGRKEVISGATAGSLSLCTFYYGFEEGDGFKEDIIIISLISFPWFTFVF